jgi:hypothetical protein
MSSSVAAAATAATAAKDKKNAKPAVPRVVNTLVCPPEKHISVESAELKAALKARLDLGDRAQFDQLSQLMEGIANFDFYYLKKRMKENFLPFATGARHSTYLQRQGRTLPTTPDLDDKEGKFIADVYEVLRASHYSLLDRDQWQIATSEDFSVSHPVAVNWAYMDSSMLQRFWAQDPERRAIRDDLPEEMADRILVFHRGVGVAKQSGLLIPQKVDLLVEYTVLWLVDLVTGGMTRKLRGGDHEAAAKKIAKVEAAKAKKANGGVSPVPPGSTSASPTPGAGAGGMDAAAKAATAAVDAEGVRGAAAASSSSSAAPSTLAPSVSKRPILSAKRSVRKLSHSVTERGRVEGDRYTMSTHKFAKVVERNTLKRQCPTLLTLLKAFPRSMELQEPTFKDVVVLYRWVLQSQEGLGKRAFRLSLSHSTPGAHAHALPPLPLSQTPPPPRPPPPPQPPQQPRLPGAQASARLWTPPQQVARGAHEGHPQLPQHLRQGVRGDAHGRHGGDLA